MPAYSAPRNATGKSAGGAAPHPVGQFAVAQALRVVDVRERAGAARVQRQQVCGGVEPLRRRVNHRFVVLRHVM
jgi:hypothetical protein